jgi:hypothetical protein
MAFAVSTVHAASAPTNWNYELDLKWVKDSADFTSGSGATRQNSSTVSWGYSGGVDGSVNKYGDPSYLRSSIVIDPTSVYSNSPLVTNGNAVDANAFTHYNNEIDGTFKTLTSVQLKLDITLTAIDGYEKSWTKTFDVYFNETPNLTGNSVTDGDIFAITWNGDYSETFTYDGYDYTFNYFETTSAISALSSTACAKVKQSNCVGFVTNESAKTPVEFAFNVQAVPEPETYAMLLAGLGIVGMMARRRRNII